MSRFAQFYSGAKKIRKKNQSFSNNHTCACSRQNNSGTTIDLEAKFIQSLEKVFEITLQHKAVLGLQYEDQNHVRKIYRNAVVCVNNTVIFFSQAFGLRTVSQALLCVVK